MATERFAPYGEYVDYDPAVHEQRVIELARDLGRSEFGVDWEGEKAKIDWDMIYGAFELEGLDVPSYDDPLARLIKREWTKARGEDPV